MKVEQGFFLDGIDLFRDDFAVNKAVERAVPIFPDRAYPSFAGSDLAAVTAETALNLAIAYFLIKHRFFHDRWIFFHPFTSIRLDSGKFMPQAPGFFPETPWKDRRLPDAG